jgi:hypothetical protein
MTHIVLHIVTHKDTQTHNYSGRDNVIQGIEAFPITWEVQENCESREDYGHKLWGTLVDYMLHGGTMTAVTYGVML